MKKKYIIGFVAFLAVTWVVTYVAWSHHLDKKIDEQFAAMQTQLEEEPEVIGVHLKELDVELSDLTSDAELGTIVDITVSYADRPDEDKQAYVVYDDNIPHPGYSDDKYGKIILPSDWKKEGDA